MSALIGAAGGGVIVVLSVHLIALYGRPSKALLGALAVVCICLGALCPLLLAPAQALAAMLLGWTLSILSTIDVVSLRLPDTFTVPICVVGLAWHLTIKCGLEQSLLGCVLGYAIFRGLDVAYRRWRGRSGLGHGDAKLFAAAGAWLGLDALPAVTLGACAAGFMWAALSFMRSGVSTATRPLAFGPPLCLAFWLVFVMRVSATS